jgi:uncharacterized membrane protein YphA (DoxX/SURF4 family)
MTVLLIVLGVVFLAAGAGKVAGVRFTRDNFARWPIDKGQRVPIGVVEIVIGVLALIGLGSDGVAVVACVGVLISMAIALAVHLKAKDPIALTAGAPIFFVLGLITLVTI